MKAAVLMPVKAFSAAKQRLASALDPDQRIRLARWMADGVVDAVGDMPIFVACDDFDVRSWAESRGATIAWGAGLGLNGAVDDGVDRVADAGFDHVIISHSDLLRPARLTRVARAGTTTFVPDRHRDGTNVMSFPTHSPIAAAYGAGSFHRHLEAAVVLGGAIEIRADSELSLDIDTPSDLTHPLIREVLPSWLPTIPVNRFTHDIR